MKNKAILCQYHANNIYHTLYKAIFFLLNDIYKFLSLYFPLFFIHLVYFMFSYFLVFDHILFN
nr:MAG TPA: hypothetical protein [Caudoviricetes sp.]